MYRARTGLARDLVMISLYLFYVTDGDEVEPTKLRVKYKIGKVIGEGNFATVKECVEKFVCSFLQ